jgi:hypothetical protein
MNYQLQPGLINIDEQTTPSSSATDSFVIPPQPSNLNLCCRPNTELYGTAPYKAGKGAPNHLIELDDMLRPQSTTQFKKILTDTLQEHSFPWNTMPCSVELPTKTIVPGSTRAYNQNIMYEQRYVNK